MANAPLSVDLRPPKRGGLGRIAPKHFVTLRRILGRVHELEALERALALASKFFIALIPAALLAMSLLPHRSSFADSIVLRLGLTGEGARVVRQLFASPAQVRGAMSALGILILAYAILSMAQALQRVYEDAWRLPRVHARRTARALIWMLTALLYFAAISPLRATLAGAEPTAVRVYAPILLGSFVWAITGQFSARDSFSSSPDPIHVGVTVSSSINRFPWQDDILRSLRRSGETTVKEVTVTIAAEGVDSDALDRGVAENLEHLVHMHLAVYLGGGDGLDRRVRLTPAGEQAADSLP